MDRRGILMFEAAIWVSALLTILAFMAAWTVAAARIRRPALRIPLLVLGALVALAPGAAVTYAAGWFSQWPILSSRLGYALSWTIACAAGVVTLAIRGEARSSRRAAPRVARWLFVKLALAFAGCLLATISIAWGRQPPRATRSSPCANKPSPTPGQLPRPPLKRTPHLSTSKPLRR